MNLKNGLSAIFIFVTLNQSFSFASSSNYQAIHANLLISGDLVINKPLVITKNSEIIWVGEEKKAPVLHKNTKHHFLDNSTILPGLIDTHAHLLSEWKTSAGDIWENLYINSTQSEERGLEIGKSLSKEMIYSGFTTARVLGNSGNNVDLRLRKLIDTNQVDGPRLIAAGKALCPPGGQFPRITDEYSAVIKNDYYEVNSPENAKQAVLELVASGVDVIKIIVDNKIENEASPRVLSLDTIKMIVSTARENNLKVAAHAEYEIGMRVAIEGGVDSIEHANDYNESMIPLLLEKKTYLVPTYSTGEFYAARNGKPEKIPEYNEFVAKEMRMFNKALKAGVNVVLGSDAMYSLKSGDRGDNSALMFQAAALGGIDPLDIIKMGTIHAAKLLGLPNVGSINVGNIADIIAVDGNPIEDIKVLSKVSFVMKEGRVIKSSKSK